MKSLATAILLSASSLLASCVSPDQGRWEPAGAGSVRESSFSHVGPESVGKPQYNGWRTTSGDREATRKSIARDVPYGVVSPSGKVVYQ